ncbi:MAG: Spy/CpxP family protein refolding chaperone [Pseudolabrys sp.]
MLRISGGLTAFTVLLAASLPLSAIAQEKEKKDRPAKTAPAARQAPRVAPPAARPQRAAPAPPPQRQAAPPPRQAAPPPPRQAAPPPQFRRAVPPPQARQPAPPPQRQAAPPPQRQAPAAVQQRREQIQQRVQQHRIERQQRAQERLPQRQPTPAAAAQPQQPQAIPRQAVTPQQPPPIDRAQQLRQAREERAQRARENRELRQLPPAQRAQRREDFQRAREQRIQQRQQGRDNVLAPQNRNATTTPNALTTQGAIATQQQRAGRRNGAARISQQAARQGRFAAPLRARAALVAAPNAAAVRDFDGRRARAARYDTRRAWRSGLRAAFVPWFGPVFWPYAYNDIFYYSFWPGGYDDGYWHYAYDDFVDGLFWGEVGPPADYVDAAPAPAASPAPPVTYAAVQSVCKQPGSGVTAWPFAEIERIGLSAEQKQRLGDVREAAKDAAAAFRETCPLDQGGPHTPPGRLRMMTARLDATLAAVRTVRPALEAFYESLSDEQKARFNEIGPKDAARDGRSSTEVREATTDNGKSCAEPKPGLANLPIERIEDVVKPTDAQLGGLQQLEDATVKAVSILQAACPEDVPQTPTGRLELMEKRLQAMLDAANEVKPALDAFYASLSNEQKARFNTIGRQLAQNDERTGN